MVSIYYESSDGETYQIDEVSQRLLVYIYLHSKARSEDVIDPVGAENEHVVHARVESKLGPSAAGLLVTETSSQMKLDGMRSTDINSFVLTDKGEEFVKKHRSDLSMPVEVAELAKRVAELQIEDKLVVKNLSDRINTLEDRIHNLENRLD